MDQYRISKIDDRQILIAASEFGWIHERRIKRRFWAEIEPSRGKNAQLVYGGFFKSLTGYWIARSKVAQMSCKAWRWRTCILNRNRMVSSIRGAL